MDHSRILNAMRQRKYRMKRALEDPEYKQKECERIKKIQKKKKGELTPIEIEEKRIRRRKQKHIERERKKQRKLAKNESQTPNLSDLDTTSHILPYKCVQTYNKAVIKCMLSLPSCPLKQRRVVEGVCERLGIKLVKEMEMPTHFLEVSLSDGSDMKAEEN